MLLASLHLYIYLSYFSDSYFLLLPQDKAYG